MQNERGTYGAFVAKNFGFTIRMLGARAVSVTWMARAKIGTANRNLI